MSSTLRAAHKRARRGSAGEAIPRVDASLASWVALGAALVAGAALIYHLTRTTTFWFDEWSWVLGRRGGGLHSLLEPHNEHLSLVPVAIYKLLFATAGISSYVPWRIVVIAGHLAVVTLLYVYARPRVGPYLALLAALLILFLGPGWQDILWGFQIGWMIPVAAGIGALLLLDRHDRAGDVAACVLAIVALASSGVGVAVALGLVAEIALGRRRWADAWIVALPLFLYAAWSIGYQHAHVVHNAAFVAEHFVTGSAASSLAALLGVSGMSVADEAGTNLAYGVPLALAALAFLVWWTVRRRGWPARAVTLAVILLSFWLLTALNRAFISTPYTSRYLYIGCTFVLLLAIEVAKGVRIRWPAGVVLGVVTVAAVVSNIGILRDGAAYLRTSAPGARADLGALDIARRIVPADYVATSFPGYPFVVVRAGAYFATERAVGTPADTVAQLQVEREPGREAADAELVRAHGIALTPAAGGAASAAPPALDGVAGGSAAVRGSCVSFGASPVSATGAGGIVDVTVSSPAVLISAQGAAATVAVRRFAVGFHALGSLRAGASASARFTPDAANVPWHLQVQSSAGASVCSLSGAA